MNNLCTFFCTFPISAVNLVTGMADLQAGSSLQSGTITDLLQTITNNVGVALEIRNHTKWNLIHPRLIFNAGTAHMSPGEVKSGTREVMAMKKTDHAATGSAGTVSWEIEGFNQRLVIMWSAPYSFDLHTNWLGIGVIGDVNLVHENTFSEMYRDKETWFRRKEFYKDTNSLHYESDNLAIVGQMGSGHKAEIIIDVNPKHTDDGVKKE